LFAALFAREFGDTRTALLAALFLATFPFEVIYSTHLYPDLLCGSFGALSLWFWIRGLRDDRRSDFLTAGAAFAAAYLCRITCIMAGPIYLALWIRAGRFRRPRMLWAIVVPAAVILAEMAVYALTTDSALYRWYAIVKERSDVENLATIRTPTAGGAFWTDPLLMIVSSHEYALYLGVALAAAVFAIWKWPAFRPAAIWLLIGFVWLSYGTTVPTDWITLHRDPRYNAILFVPAAVLAARFVAGLVRPLRWLAAATLVTMGIAASSLDQASSLTTPHRAFLQTDYFRKAALQPFDYFSARFEYGLTAPPPFAAVRDRGNDMLMGQIGILPGTRFVPSADVPFLVFSDTHFPNLRKQLLSEGWSEAGRITGQPNSGRVAVARILKLFPSQRTRAERILLPPDLAVFHNPRMALSR
jgi:hypothetical protein